MTTTIQRVGPNVAYSIFKYVRTVQYTVSSVTQTFRQRFGDLQIIGAYPDELQEMTKPTLALTGPGDMVQDDHEYFGGPAGGQVSRPDRLMFSIFGFVMGRGSDEANRKYRDQLMNDLYEVLASDAADAGITLYDAETDAEVGAIEVDAASVRARALPANAPMFEADRYKFVVSFEVPYE